MICQLRASFGKSIEKWLRSQRISERRKKKKRMSITMKMGKREKNVENSLRTLTVISGELWEAVEKPKKGKLRK